MKYKAIIFDVDGTLVNSKEAVLEGLRATFDEYKLGDMSKYDLNELFALSNELLVKKIGLPESEHEEFIRSYMLNIFSRVEMVKLYKDASEILNNLRNRGLKLGIVTNRLRREVDLDPTIQTVIHLFDSVVCADDVENHKPAGDSVVKCVLDLGISSTDALYIGDDLVDKYAAEEAGVDFGFASWWREERLEGKYNFKEIEEVYDLV